MRSAGFRPLLGHALVSVPPQGKIGAERALRPLQRERLSRLLAALRLWQRTTEGEFPGELSSPAPQWGHVALRSFAFPVSARAFGPPLGPHSLFQSPGGRGSGPKRGLVTDEPTGEECPSSMSGSVRRLMIAT